MAAAEYKVAAPSDQDPVELAKVNKKIESAKSAYPKKPAEQEPRRGHHTHIRAGEIIALRQQRFARHNGQRVGAAVSEVQPGGMVAFANRA